MSARRFYIICYDTPSNRRRRKLHQVLKDFAVAVQKSVFETFLDDDRFAKMVTKIERHIDGGTDSVRIYVLSAEAQQAMRVWGLPGLLGDPDHHVVVTADEPGSDGSLAASPASAAAATSVPASDEDDEVDAGIIDAL